MLQQLIVSFIIAANFFVAFLVLKKNSQSATNRLIALLALLLTCWTIFNYIALQPQSEFMRLTWVRVVMVTTSPFGVLVYLLASVFPGNKYTVSKVQTALMVGLVFLTAIVSTTPLVFQKLINFSDGNFTLIPGIGIALFATTLLLFNVLGFIKFVRKMRASHGVQRKQFQLVLIGMIISFSLILLTNFIAVVLFQSVNLTFFGPPLTLIMVGSMTYAVLKHRFLDIRMAIARSISFSILILIIALFYSAVIFVLTRFLLEEQISAQATAVSAVIALPVLLTFERLKKTIQKATERLFFKYEYDLEKVVQELASMMSSTLDLTTLVRQVINILERRVKVAEAQIGIVTDKKMEVYTNSKLVVTPEATAAYFELTQVARKREDNILIFDELEEGSLKQQMRDLNLEIIQALETRDVFLGSIFLQFKSSGEPYSAQDIQVLKILAPQLIVAVQNAQSFDEITKFNVTLKQEVAAATKELKAANAHLKELDVLKDQFVSIASHELRTPLSAIKSYLWMALEGKGGELTEKQHYYIQRSSNATERLISLVNDMLNISRIEAGRIALDVVKTDMKQLCLEVVEEVTPRSKELGLTVKFSESKEQAEKPVPAVAADTNKIREVLINLIGNSLKFTPKGGEIVMTLEIVDDMVITQVCDNGVGIEADNIKNLFQKFDLMQDSYQTNKDVSQGTGLGLFICKSIIELHHGKIWATSEGKMKGSQFRFSLLPATSENLKLLQSEHKPAPDSAEIIHNDL